MPRTRWAGSRSHSWALMALAGLFWVPGFSFAYEDDARALYKEGLRAYRAGESAKAEDLFRRSGAADPQYPYPFLALGRICHEIFNQETKRYEDAAAAYQRVAQILRDHPPAEREQALYQVRYYEGLLRLKGGEYDRAVEQLRAFLEVSPDFDRLQDVHNAIGIAMYYLDQYDKAVDHFRTAINADPELAEARFNLRSVFTRLSIYNEAVVLARAGELGLAEEKLHRLKTFAPRYLPGRRLEARVLLELGREDESGRVLTEILGYDQADPLTYGIRLDLAKLLAKRGDADNALRLLRENVERFPNIQDRRLMQEVVQLIAQLGTPP